MAAAAPPHQRAAGRGSVRNRKAVRMKTILQKGPHLKPEGPCFFCLATPLGWVPAMPPLLYSLLPRGTGEIPVKMGKEACTPATNTNEPNHFVSCLLGDGEQTEKSQHNGHQHHQNDDCQDDFCCARKKKKKEMLVSQKDRNPWPTSLSTLRFRQRLRSAGFSRALTLSGARSPSPSSPCGPSRLECIISSQRAQTDGMGTAVRPGPDRRSTHFSAPAGQRRGGGVTGGRGTSASAGLRRERQFPSGRRSPSVGLVYLAGGQGHPPSLSCLSRSGVPPGGVQGDAPAGSPSLYEGLFGRGGCERRRSCWRSRCT